TGQRLRGSHVLLRVGRRLELLFGWIDRWTRCAATLGGEEWMEGQDYSERQDRCEKYARRHAYNPNHEEHEEREAKILFPSRSSRPSWFGKVLASRRPRFRRFIRDVLVRDRLQPNQPLLPRCRVYERIWLTGLAALQLHHPFEGTAVRI